MAFSLKFNGVTPPPFLKVTGIDQSILPDIEHYNTQVTGAYGSIDGGIEVKSKQFTVNYMIQFEDSIDDTYYVEELSRWCIGNNYKVSKLQLDDSGYYYKARVTDASDFTDSILYGSGSIVFTASDPRKYAPSPTSVSIANGTTVNYTGLVPVGPVVTFSASGTKSVKITNVTTGESILLSDDNITGNITVDCNKKYVAVGNVKKMKLLSLSNDWVRLFPGNNVFNVTVSGGGISNLKMEYTVCK